MQVVEAQFEVLSIPEPVSLPFESLDFVNQALDGAAGDAVIEVVEEACAVRSKGFPHSLERLDPRAHGIPAPDGWRKHG